MESDQTTAGRKPAVVGLGLTDLLAASSLPSVLEVLKNNVDVKKDVSDDVLFRWSQPGHLSGGLISLDWHKGYNKALEELQEEMDATLKGEAIPVLVRPRNLHSRSTRGHADSLSDLSLSDCLPK